MPHARQPFETSGQGAQCLSSTPTVAGFGISARNGIERTRRELAVPGPGQFKLRTLEALLHGRQLKLRTLVIWSQRCAHAFSEWAWRVCSCVAGVGWNTYGSSRSLCQAGEGLISA
eukprot:14656113-Alexandrium_andersonii.AAC.1